jgi:spermidine synthase
MRVWETVAESAGKQGRLELRRRGADFLLLLEGRILMSSREDRSERALAAAVCERLTGRPAPRVLLGGLGLGRTLRAALDALPPRAEVEVAELEPAVVEWCRGPLAELAGRALEDPRVTVFSGDVRERAAASPRDAIVLDLSEGPAPSGLRHDPLYGPAALAGWREALTAGGTLGVWGEAPSRAFERALGRAGFGFVRLRPGRGARRHVVYVAQPSTGRVSRRRVP